ncbi:hypothetical protein FEM48_Zijuj02G0193600 [Ziziphus jujuba var. spinosa]|uniref:Uncharacterized protein n=1 Tax=Ziziphus jujuba var. spinosa TaxID=714518 RepID=A0A978VXI4_ZIZJJ|nr:hypothetical protein FEM48_Zijuj02G0193600 [Ziziphus jujuba var. spinosa]
MSTTTIGAIAAARRPKWHYPPPAPTPRILHLPRRPRRKATKNNNHPTGKSISASAAAAEARKKERKGKLETLFDQERAFTRAGVPIVLLEYEGESERRRKRVEEGENRWGGSVVEEEKWRFQAEMMRAECNLLRMEKRIAVKKLDRNRVKMEKILRSSVHALISGKNKISEGNNVKMVVEEEIQRLAEKLEKMRRNLERKDLESRNYNNFDKQAALLRRRLELFRGTSDKICVKEIQEMAEMSLSIKSKCRVSENLVSSDSSNVEILRRKMEGLSNGLLLERMKEEYGSMLSTANSSVASSASTSQRIEFADSSSSLVRQPYKEIVSHEENMCSGHCKAIVRRIVEQVRAETEQWSQMQEMLGKVREEMEELQASRDFWEDRALDYDHQMQSLHSAVKEWRQKAASSESRANELESNISKLSGELERLKKEEEKKEETNSKCTPSLTPWEAQNEMEKRVLVCRLKENHQTYENKSSSKHKFTSDLNKKANTKSNGLVAPKRSPFQDIGNSSVLDRQQSNANFPLHCPLAPNTSKNF